MKDLQKLYNDCVMELKRINMDISNKITEVKINGRLRTTMGICYRNNRTGNYSIGINQALMSDTADEMEVKDTIIHELLHTCPGSFNHGYEWKLRADRVNRMLGYHVSTCASRQEVEAKGIQLKIEDWKYALECVNCGKQYKRKRWGYALENPSNYKCGKCGGELKTISLDGSMIKHVSIRKVNVKL